MCRLRQNKRSEIYGKHAVGFTLLELLIAVSILLILLAITAAAIRVNNNADRVRGGARTLQSYLLGAKDRAIYAKAPRGVRFLRDGTDARVVTSMVYVEPTESWKGTVNIVPYDGVPANWSPSNPMRRVLMANTKQQPSWADLDTAGLLGAGLRIRIPANDRGVWYIIQKMDVSGTSRELVLTTEIRNPNSTGLLSDSAEIELPPSVVQNAEPVQLPRGVVIDMDRAGYYQPGPVTFTPKFPRSWVDASGNYTSRMDLMFSPRGSITGLAAATGVIHFYLTDQAAADLNLDPGFKDNSSGTPILPAGIDPATAIPDKMLVSVFTRSGNVLVSPVRTFDGVNNRTGASGADGYADDPFFYSERGEVAGK